MLAALLICALGASLATPDRFRVAGFTTPGSQSTRALAVLHRELGYDPTAGLVILARAGTGFAAAPPRAAVQQLAARIGADRAVGSVQTAFGAGGVPALLSRDRRETLLLVHFHSTSQDAVAGPIDHLRAHLRQPGLELSVGGYDVAFIDVNRAVRSDLVRAELIAFPLLALLMLMLFRGLAATTIPLGIGATSVIGTFAGLRLLASAINISIFALDLALLLGLGLAVDYGLFLLARYREEALAHGTGAAALRMTLATAGRAVLLSGCALAGASTALLLFPQQFIYSMGIAGVTVSLLSAGAALLIAPPLILIAGQRLQPRRPAAPHAGAAPRGRWYRWAQWVMRRPFDVALVSVLLLIAAAAPALRLTPTFADQAAIPHGYQSRSVADTIDANFTPHLMYPVNIAVTSRHLGPFVLGASIARAPGVALVVPITTPSHRPVGAQAVLSGPPYATPSQRLVAAIRAGHGPLLVGGNTAEFVDLKHSIEARAPLALALAAMATLLVLLVLSGSLVLAVKALVFDLFGLAAALGLLVLIFQDHALGIQTLLGYHGPAAIEATAAVVIVASTFGLTTDYSVLLLSRIVEEHEAGRPDQEAVALGIERSGPVISSSALLLVVALLALASSRVFLVKELTVGQALAIVVDVSFVRLLLVPSFMRILGPANWWAPSSLRRARARLARRLER